MSQATPKRFQVDSTVQWDISDEIYLKNLILITDTDAKQANPVPDNGKNSGYLLQILRHNDVSPYLPDPFRHREPFATIVGVKRDGEMEADGTTPWLRWYAIVFDRTSSDYILASRRVSAQNLLNNNKVLMISEKNATEKYKQYPDVNAFRAAVREQKERRILNVVHNGFLVFFSGDDCYLLIENNYLVFHSDWTLISRRVFDTKRDDTIEVYSKANRLAYEPVVNGMAIFHAVVQCDTAKEWVEGAKGSQDRSKPFLVIGEWNAILDKTKIQQLIGRRQVPNN